MHERDSIAKNGNCKFCTYKIDYIEHFFLSCDKISLIWKNVKEYAYLKFDKLIKRLMEQISSSSPFFFLFTMRTAFKGYNHLL